MFDLPRDAGAGVRLVLRGEAGEADRPFVAIASRGRAGEPALRAAAPRRQSAAAGGNRARSGEALRFCDHRRRLGAVRGQRRDLRRLVGEARLRSAARPACRVRARQQDGGGAGDPPLGPCRAALAFDGRRLGALLARHHPHPARPHVPYRLRRRQPRQMAARIRDPRTSRRGRRRPGSRWGERPLSRFVGFTPNASSTSSSPPTTSSATPS